MARPLVGIDRLNNCGTMILPREFPVSEIGVTGHDRMKNRKPDEARLDAALAHGLARVALGLNIAIHGYSRLPK